MRTGKEMCHTYDDIVEVLPQLWRETIALLKEVMEKISMLMRCGESIEEKCFTLQYGSFGHSMNGTDVTQSY
jgi:hypothetical protein